MVSPSAYAIDETGLGALISCKGLKGSEGCDRCFEGGNLYAGQMYRLYNTIQNVHLDDSEVFLHRDDLGKVSFLNLQNEYADWNFHQIEFEVPQGISWNFVESGKRYHKLPKTVGILRFLETSHGKGLMMTRISKQVNSNNYAIQIKYETNLYRRKQEGGDLIKEQSAACSYHRPRWREGNE